MEGTLLAYLKQREWASALLAGEGESLPGYSTFYITIDLTPKGKSESYCCCGGVTDNQLKSGQKDNSRDVVIAVFSYLSLLKGSVRDLRAKYEECKQYC